MGHRSGQRLVKRLIRQLQGQQPLQVVPQRGLSLALHRSGPPTGKPLDHLRGFHARSIPEHLVHPELVVQLQIIFGIQQRLLQLPQQCLSERAAQITLIRLIGAFIDASVVEADAGQYRVCVPVVYRTGLSQGGQRWQVRSGGCRTVTIPLSLLEAGQVRADIFHIRGVATDTACPHHHQTHDTGRQSRVSRAPPPLPPAFIAWIGAHQLRLRKNHILKEPSQEKAFTPIHPRCGRFAPKPELCRHGTDQAINRRAILGAARVIDAAQQRLVTIAIRGKGLLDKPLDQAVELFKLGRKMLDGGPTLGIAFLMKSPDQTFVQSGFELTKLGVNKLKVRGRLHRTGAGQAEAPHLLTLVFPQVFEKLIEARDQVRLGEHEIDGKAHLQLTHQIINAGANGASMTGALFFGLGEQILHADRDNHAVDRPATAVLFQKPQKPLPGRTVHHPVTVLGRVTSRGVHQHGIIGEPPIAVSGSANALQRSGTKLFGQGKLQPGVHQRGGFARTRRAHHDVPGQLIQGSTLVGTAPKTTLPKHGQRFEKALLNLLDILGRLTTDIVRCVGLALLNVVHHRLILLAIPPLQAQVIQPPQHQQHQNDQQSGDAAGQGRRVFIAKLDQGSAKPDQQRQN